MARSKSKFRGGTPERDNREQHVFYVFGETDQGKPSNQPVKITVWANNTKDAIGKLSLVQSGVLFMTEAEYHERTKAAQQAAQQTA